MESRDVDARPCETGLMGHTSQRTPPPPTLELRAGMIRGSRVYGLDSYPAQRLRQPPTCSRLRSDDFSSLAHAQRVRHTSRTNSPADAAQTRTRTRSHGRKLAHARARRRAGAPPPPPTAAPVGRPGRRYPHRGPRAGRTGGTPSDCPSSFAIRPPTPFAVPRNHPPRGSRACSFPFPGSRSSERLYFLSTTHNNCRSILRIYLYFHSNRFFFRVIEYFGVSLLFLLNNVLCPRPSSCHR
ncbi:unnamed protein product [Aphis gossypii]|uniref:Uncharacterized protein n=1 Tax=Aphis gossypii TaxID=80765 RepID=A0A9P0JCN1_APHGO|nr:unnamed protein product [Aphis gossypii]